MMTNQEQVAQIIAEVTARIEADEAHTKQFTFTKFERGTKKGVQAKVEGSFNGIAFEMVTFTKVAKGWEITLLPKGDFRFTESQGKFETLKEAKRHALKNSGAA